MSDVLEGIARREQETMGDYDEWLESWQKRRDAGFETVLLTRQDDCLAVLLMDGNSGELQTLGWEFVPGNNTPPPSDMGIRDAATSEHRLAVEWPELGWNSPAHPSVRGKGVFLYPLGPVRADVAESVLYNLTVMGDEILHVYVENGWKQRHIRAIVGGRTVAEAMPVISRFTTTSNVHHSLAMSLAVEEAWAVNVPPEIQMTRTLMAELERVYSHVGDLAALAVSTGLPVPQMEYLHLKEELLRINHLLFGHRYMRGSIVPGGLDTRLWPANVNMSGVRDTVERVTRHCAKIAYDLERTTSFLDRLHGAGIIPPTTIHAVRPVGPVGRSAGREVDVRRVRPYAAYVDMPIPVVMASQADSYARFHVRILELEASLQFIRKILEQWERTLVLKVSAHNRTPIKGAPATRSGTGIVEAARGLLGYWIYLDPNSGRILDLGVATPSQRNWMAYPAAMANGNILQDFPIIDASFSLSVAGWDG